MAAIQQFLASQPKWLVLLFGITLVALIGYIDYLTGDYSILIFYLFPVSVVSWIGGRWPGTVTASCSGGARFISDYTLFDRSHRFYWNAFEDMLFLLIIAILVDLLRRALERDTVGRA